MKPPPSGDLKTASPNVINLGLSSKESIFSCDTRLNDVSQEKEIRRGKRGHGLEESQNEDVTLSATLSLNIDEKLHHQKRGKHGHVLEESQNEDVTLSATLSLNIDANISQYTMKRGSAVTIQENELAQIDDWLQYLNKNENVGANIIPCDH
ncbi:unnamed protein product [Mytilus edulis]|uniref:Uncharacterized protein n=1 Tax=Mytilus edulis TaxID=6550 RepID=A0A8S3V309_MYTED|nr:unnamed protein product [Mytilus edulis]